MPQSNAIRLQNGLFREQAVFVRGQWFGDQSVLCDLHSLFSEYFCHGSLVLFGYSVFVVDCKFDFGCQ